METLPGALHRNQSSRPWPLRDRTNAGCVMTGISRDMGFFMRAGYAAFKPAMHLFLKQPNAGAFTR